MNKVDHKPPIMSDTQSSLIFATISLIPGNTARYIALGVAISIRCLGSLRLTSPHRQLDRIDLALNTTTELLKSAQLECARDHGILCYQGLRLFQ
jgi:hypothetical protein